MARIEDLVNRLALSGVEVRELTKWNQSMVNDYLGIQESLQVIARELDALTNFIAPTTMNVNSSGVVTGTVDDVKVLHDGNLVQIAEVAGLPPAGAIDVDFIFENVDTFNGIVTYLRYEGSSTHVVTQNLYDFDAAVDDSFILIPSGLRNQYRTILIPDDGRYIDADNNVRLSIIHETSGIVSHDIYIEYVALIGLEV